MYLIAQCSEEKHDPKTVQGVSIDRMLSAALVRDFLPVPVCSVQLDATAVRLHNNKLLSYHNDMDKRYKPRAASGTQLRCAVAQLVET